MAKRIRSEEKKIFCDTFRADLYCDCALLCKNIAIRVSGIDTPEIRGKCKKEKELAIKARDFARRFLNRHMNQTTDNALIIFSIIYRRD